MTKHGLPPTIRELMGYLKVSSPHGIMGHIKALERKGHITRTTGSRNIRLKGPRVCPHCGKRL